MAFIPTTANEADTAALMDCLLATQVGETCTYAAMSAAIGRNVNNARHLILKALRRLSREHGAIFVSVWRVGYQRLAANDAHKLGITTRARIRRSAHRTAETIASAVERANDLTDAARTKAMAEIGAMNMLAHLATERITHALPPVQKPRPVAEHLTGLLAHINNGNAA